MSSSTEAENLKAALLAEGFPASVWLTGQVPSRELRRGRYTRESMTHPGKMLPAISRYAIRTYTDQGRRWQRRWVADVLAPFLAAAPPEARGDLHESVILRRKLDQDEHRQFGVS